MRLRDVASIRQYRSVVETERLKMGEANEGVMALDGGDEREGEFDELRQLHALEVDNCIASERRGADEGDARSGHAEALCERCLGREKVAA